MANFNIPTADQVTENNQKIFENLQNKLGFVPNLYAYYAHSDTALGDYLEFQNRKSLLRAKEKEVIHLVTSEINGCSYCLAAHTAIGKMNGFSDQQILEIRSGSASFDPRLDAIARFTHEVVSSRGKISARAKALLSTNGFNDAEVVDITVAIGTKIISNYLHNIADFAVDFPAAPSLKEVAIA